MHPDHAQEPAPHLSKPIAPVPLLVLDTNVVLDWLAFGDARVRAIADSIERGLLRAATDAACLRELRRVLGYAQVKLGAAAQALAFERYAALAKVFEILEPETLSGMPQCEDPDDQKFLELAWRARASHLLTRDKALLKLARQLTRLGRFSVLTPQDFHLRRQ